MFKISGRAQLSLRRLAAGGGTTRGSYNGGGRSELTLPPVPLPAIHPAVASATPEELIAAGYADYDRWRIPPDWREREAEKKRKRTPAEIRAQKREHQRKYVAANREQVNARRRKR